jgi:hypothetical protein
MTTDGDGYLNRIVDEASLSDYLKTHLGAVDDYEIRHHQ